MTTSDFKYPVASVDKYGNVYISIDENTLTTINNASLKAHNWTDSYIVDCDGIAAKIEDMRFISGIGSFWGYSIFFDRLIRVEIILGEEFSMSLDEIKKPILRYIHGGMSSVVSPSAVLQDMRTIKATKTIDDLFRLALPYMDLQDFWQTFKKH